jgi:adenylate kinase family enzyme
MNADVMLKRVEMRRVVIFGNSGSGKSTLAKKYTARYELPHLDLDTLAWNDTNPPSRKPLEDSARQIARFIEKNNEWVVEGCYSDLLNLISNRATELIFLNPGVETCIENCKNRPWEPHKYRSKEEQDKNLEMLLNWVRQYSIRDDEFSLASHRKLFDEFVGEKTEYTSNDRIA